MRPFPMLVETFASASYISSEAREWRGDFAPQFICLVGSVAANRICAIYTHSAGEFFGAAMMCKRKYITHNLEIFSFRMHTACMHTYIRTNLNGARDICRSSELNALRVCSSRRCCCWMSMVLLVSHFACIYSVADSPDQRDVLGHAWMLDALRTGGKRARSLSHKQKRSRLLLCGTEIPNGKKECNQTIN